jgi:hypothetical protein
MEESIIKNGTPEKIYKYHGINPYLFELLEKGSVWFSHQNDLNDPFDCKYAMSDKFLFSILQSSCKDVLLDLKKGIPQMPEISDEKFFEFMKPRFQTDEWMSGFYNMMFGELAGWSVCCFTTNPINEIMWAHYAKNSKGICLEFDLSKSPELFEKIHPVKYSNQLPQIDSADQLPEALLVKRLAWSIEEEWRIISNVSGHKNFNKEALTAIYFGFNVGTKTIEEIRKILFASGYKNVEFKRVAFKINGFTLNNIEDDLQVKKLLDLN